MNDVGRDVLVQAWMEKRPRLKGALHNLSDRSSCAIGLLHEAIHKNSFDKALKCYLRWSSPECFTAIATTFGIDSPKEWHRLVERNNDTDQTFLDIARKHE